MTPTGLCRQLTALLVFSAVMLTAIVASAQSPTRTPDWVNIKDPKFGAIGNGIHDDTAAIQAAIDYAFAHKLSAVYCPDGTYRTTSTIYLDPPGNLRLNPSNPPLFTFSIAFFGDPTSGAAENPGCVIQPNFNNTIAFVVGSGQGMRVSDVSVNGPNTGYRGAQNSAGVGIGIAGGNGGASGTLIENTYVSNFYTLYKTDAAGGGALSDSNTFRKIGGSNAYFGVWVAGTQAYIDDIIEPRIGDSDIFVSSNFSKQVNIFNGVLATASSKNSTFSISGTSNLGSGCGSWCFTTTIASPDSYINTLVYNSYMLVTPHFGVVPLVLNAWNPTTNVATFGFYQPWLIANYGRSPNFPIIRNDVMAATTLYAAERVITTQGAGITMDGTHIENPGVCTTVFDPTTVWGGQVSNEIKNIFFDYDPTLVSQGNATEIACQQSFPFLSVAAGQPLKLSGGDWLSATTNPPNPLIIDAASGSLIRGSQLGSDTPGIDWFNIRVFDQQGCAWSQVGGSGSSPYCTQPTQFDTMARGGGQWDTDYFLPASFQSTAAQRQVLEGELTSPFCGYEPCPWTTPNLSPPIYSLVSGSPGALGSYPPIACRTVFKSVDWNTAALPHLYLRSASCPGYSYGQNFTDALIGEVVTWSYMGGSDALYLDGKTLGWMFPGLGISLDNGSGPVNYIVTGVYPHYGYATVINAAGNAGGPLAGGLGTIYSCSSSCTIGQAAYAWTAY